MSHYQTHLCYRNCPGQPSGTPQKDNLQFKKKSAFLRSKQAEVSGEPEPYYFIANIIVLSALEN